MGYGMSVLTKSNAVNFKYPAYFKHFVMLKNVKRLMDDYLADYCLRNLQEFNQIRSKVSPCRIQFVEFFQLIHIHLTQEIIIFSGFLFVCHRPDGQDA